MDWSSDVCSSDLSDLIQLPPIRRCGGGCSMAILHIVPASSKMILGSGNYARHHIRTSRKKRYEIMTAYDQLGLLSLVSKPNDKAYMLIRANTDLVTENCCQFAAAFSMIDTDFLDALPPDGSSIVELASLDTAHPVFQHHKTTPNPH